MKCPKINELDFSERGEKAIKEIRRIKDLNKWLSITIVGGTFANIFAGNGIIKSSYNISQTDFDKFPSELKTAPKISKGVIHRIAKYEFIKAVTSKERLFWQSVYEGCEASL